MSLRNTINDIEGEVTVDPTTRLPRQLSPKECLNMFYETLESPDYQFEPINAKDFGFVMDRIADWVVNEAKVIKNPLHSPEVRSSVVRFIKEYVSSRPTCAFPGIDPGTFGVQLALRVRRPRSVDQGGTGLCGAASVMYTFAKNQPADFARFALDLFFNGDANFRGLEITPSMKIRQSYPLRKAKMRWAVDYVTLVSLRQCTFLTDKFHVGALRGADETTLPGQLANWLKQAGYTNVEDHTFFGKNQVKLVKAFAAQIGQSMHAPGAVADQAAKTNRLQHAQQSLTKASQALSDGKIVILFSDGALGDNLKAGTADALAARSGPTEIGHHHWMTLRKLDILGTNAVNIAVITWTGKFQGLMKLDALVSQYNGYICADPV